MVISPALGYEEVKCYGYGNLMGEEPSNALVKNDIERVEKFQIGSDNSYISDLEYFFFGTSFVRVRFTTSAGDEKKNTYHGMNPKGKFKPDSALVANNTYLYKPTAYFDNGYLAAVGMTIYDP